MQNKGFAKIIYAKGIFVGRKVRLNDKATTFAQEMKSYRIEVGITDNK